MLEMMHESDINFRKYRYDFFCAMFKYMLASTEMDTLISKERDHLENNHLTRSCESCGEMYTARKQKCDKCKGQVISAPGYDTHYDTSKKITKFVYIGQSSSNHYL